MNRFKLPISQAILLFLFKNGDKATFSSIAKHFNRSDSHISTILKKMSETNSIQKIGRKGQEIVLSPETKLSIKKFFNEFLKVKPGPPIKKNKTVI